MNISAQSTHSDPFHADSAPLNASGLPIWEVETGDTGRPPQRPVVEVIGVDSAITTAACCVHPAEISSQPAQKLSGEVSWKAAADDQIEDVPAALAAAIQASTSKPVEDPGRYPPAYTDPISKEPLYDVRDFAIPESLSAALAESESEALTLWNEAQLRAQFNALLSLPEKISDGSPAETTDVKETGEQLFLADSGDVITLDQESGFEQIDLTCFSIQSATIETNRILINDGIGVAFEIRYSGILRACFANGVVVDLTTLSISDH